MLVSCAAQHPGLEVVGQIDQGDDLRSIIEKADVVIDFSSHTATPAVAALCAERQKPLVIGTTGLSDEDRSRITGLSARIPIVLSSNFSTGVNTLFWLTRKAAEILGPGFDLEIVEMHHRLKRDAPSGTARTLAEILADVRSQQLERVLRHGRAGIVGERKPEEIGMHSLRGGDVVGDHTVVFAGPGERVELTHKASTRETFANGALRAAQWVAKSPPGLYDMQDVLGLK
jgi:4-hydroxy-tetrahydrodipicolinate reductase